MVCIELLDYSEMVQRCILPSNTALWWLSANCAKQLDNGSRIFQVGC